LPLVRVPQHTYSRTSMAVGGLRANACGVSPQTATVIGANPLAGHDAALGTQGRCRTLVVRAPGSRGVLGVPYAGYSRPCPWSPRSHPLTGGVSPASSSAPLCPCLPGPCPSPLRCRCRAHPHKPLDNSWTSIAALHGHSRAT
jgi:hypothetical protein